MENQKSFTHDKQPTDRISADASEPSVNPNGAQAPNPMQNPYYSMNIGGQQQAMPMFYGFVPQAPFPQFVEMQEKMDDLCKQQARLSAYAKQLFELHNSQEKNLTTQTEYAEIKNENALLKEENELLKKRLTENAADALEKEKETEWTDPNWQLGHIAKSMMQQMHVPLHLPPHLQKENFPFQCKNCGKGLWDAASICDDLYPVLPYDGETVYCQECFNELIFPKRIAIAQELYDYYKSCSKVRSAKLAKYKPKRETAVKSE